MAKVDNEFKAVSDGTFILSESKNENQYYFYRKDGKVLTDIDREPMEFYQALITRKMMDGDIPAMFMANNLYSEMSADGKVIRLTVYDIDKDPNLHIKKKPNFIKRLFNKMLGK